MLVVGVGDPCAAEEHLADSVGDGCGFVSWGGTNLVFYEFGV